MSLGVAEPSERQVLLLRAALLDAEQAIPAWRRWKEIDAIQTTDADSLRMLPLICRNLLALGVDDPEMGTLKGAYRHQWVATAGHLRGASRALSVLAGAGVPTMVLKGAALAGDFYGDLGVRPMSDVDILVPTDRVTDAAAALEAGGWAHAVGTPLSELLPVTHGTSFVDASNSSIDLHWHAMWSPADESDLWSAAEPVDVGEITALRPCAADQLLHTCVHGLWSEGMRLRWVPDAFAVLRATPDLDWDRVVDRARARELTLPLRDALAWLHDFGAPVPVEVLERLGDVRHGFWERAGHRAWLASQTKRRTATLAYERYRRHRVDPPGPTRRGSFVAYLRAYSAMTWGADGSTAALGPAILTRLLRRGQQAAAAPR